MRKERRGFTLIELLAVIVILAIIALIAVPVIMNVIGNVRKSAFEDSAYGIVKAGEMYYTNKLLDAEGMTSDKEFTITNGAFVGDTLEVSGSLPSNGKIKVTKEGKVAVALSNGAYCVRKATTESKIQSEKLSDLNEVCDYKKVVNPVFTKATGETSVPECITNNSECTAGTKVGVKVNDSQTYDFYVISEKESEGTITLIMNKKLGENVQWVSKDDYISAGGTEDDWGEFGNTNKGPITALKELEERTSSWTNIPLETYTLTDDNRTPLYPTMTRTARARMITHTEAYPIICGADDDSFLSGTDAYYWTTTTNNQFTAYKVVTGPCAYTGEYVDCGEGIRPVITVSKTIM